MMNLVVMAWLMYLLHIDFIVSGVKCNSSIPKYRKPAELSSVFTRYGLWPGLVNENDLKDGATIYALEEALELIRRNQNPPDCTKAKYLVTNGWKQGFGSEVHYFGVMLGIALDTGRVLLQQGGWTWRYRNKHCEGQGVKSFDCYYLPFSKCSASDAIASLGLPQHNETKDIVASWNSLEDQALASAVLKYGIQGSWHKIASSLPRKNDIMAYERWKSHGHRAMWEKRKTVKGYMDKVVRAIENPTILDFVSPTRVVTINRVTEMTTPFVADDTKMVLKMPHPEMSDGIVTIHNDLIMKESKYLPRVLKHLYSCAGLIRANEYMWWRAVSITFILRPNPSTLALMQQFRDPVVVAAEGRCVSAYVRHGDKGSEMKLVPFSQYGQAALRIFNNASHALGASASGSSGRVMFIATEDPDVIQEASKWGTENKVDVRFTEINKQILSDKRNAVNPGEIERTLPVHREFEYISYLVHLADNVKCAANICTVPSNYCRLIEELRGTVGGKANQLYVDVSSETCPSPPCFRYDVYANHMGPVYDPQQRIW